METTISIEFTQEEVGFIVFALGAFVGVEQAHAQTEAEKTRVDDLYVRAQKIVGKIGIAEEKGR